MIICVYRTFYGLQHQYHTKNAQNRSPLQHSAQFTPPAVAGKKRTAILFTVARARFKCVFFIVNKTCHIARRRKRIGNENCQLDHCTCNKLRDMRISCKKMTQFRVNIHRPFVSQGNHFDVTRTVIKRQQIIRFACVCCFCTDILIIHMELNAFCNVFSRNSNAKII